MINIYSNTILAILISFVFSIYPEAPSDYNLAYWIRQYDLKNEVFNEWVICNKPQVRSGYLVFRNNKNERVVLGKKNTYIDSHPFFVCERILVIE